MRVKNQDILETLIKKAETSSIIHKHSACLIYKNEFIAICKNEIIQENNISLHAEINTIKHFLQKYKYKKLLKNLHLIVIRVSKTKQLVNSKPCKNCVKTMKSLGIEKVTYSIENKIITQYIEEIITEHLSGFSRHFK